MWWFWWFGAGVQVLTNRGPVITVPVEYRTTTVPPVERWAPRIVVGAAQVVAGGAWVVLDIGGAWVPVEDTSRATVIPDVDRTIEVPAEYRTSAVAE